jgi:hypothetical protein
MAKHEEETHQHHKKKIEQLDLIVTKADKGNTLVVLHGNSYNRKV